MKKILKVESCSQILKSDMKISISQKWDRSIKMCEVSKRAYGQERKGLARPGHGGKVSLGEDGPGTRAPLDGGPEARKLRSLALEASLEGWALGRGQKFVGGGGTRPPSLSCLLIFPWKV